MNVDTFVYLDMLRKRLHNLPGVTEKLCFGTPAFYVNNKIFARIKEDGENLAIHSTERDKWMKKSPATFFITDHYKNYSYMLVALKSVSNVDLETLLIQAWCNRASVKLKKEFNAMKISSLRFAPLLFCSLSSAVNKRRSHNTALNVCVPLN